MTKKRLPATIAAFLYADCKPDTVDCLIRDFRKHPEWKYNRTSSDALIDRARSRAASRFLYDTDDNVLVMIDHDIFWNDGDLEHLIKSCAAKKSIVGGIYPKRAMGKVPAVRFAEEGRFTQGDDRLVEVTYIGTGFMAIHRDVLVSLARRIPITVGDFHPFFAPTLMEREGGGDPEYLSEDYAFCMRAQQDGFTIYADLFPVLEHVGEYAYRLTDAEVPMRPDKRVTFNTGDPWKPYPTMASLPKHVADYTHTPLDQMDTAVAAARQHMAEIWNNTVIEKPDDEIDYYMRDDIGRAYIFDLMQWHISGAAPRIMGQIGKVDEDTRILDYGSGIGTVALELASTSKHVHVTELNKELRDFTAYRAKELGVPLQIHPASKPLLPDEKFDLIICWHVLEHLSEVEQEQVVEWIADHLAEGGRIISQSDFHKDPIHPFHHERADNGDGLWEAVGIKRVEGDVWERVAIMAAAGG